jgi:hypothetical protein
MECWNIGIMGFEIMQRRVGGKICDDDKIETNIDLSKTQHSSIPPFHHSMIKARTEVSINTTCVSFRRPERYSETFG